MLKFNEESEAVAGFNDTLFCWKLVTHRGGSATQAARDLDVHENVLRKWGQELCEEPQEAFPGNRRHKAHERELKWLGTEAAKLKEERDILKIDAAYFAKESMRSSTLWRNTQEPGPSTRCARRSVLRVAAFTPGRCDPGAREVSATRRWVPKCVRALCSATTPTAHGVCGQPSPR